MCTHCSRAYLTAFLPRQARRIWNLVVASRRTFSSQTFLTTTRRLQDLLPLPPPHAASFCHTAGRSRSARALTSRPSFRAMRIEFGCRVATNLFIPDLLTTRRRQDLPLLRRTPLHFAHGTYAPPFLREGRVPVPTTAGSPTAASTFFSSSATRRRRHDQTKIPLPARHERANILRGIYR